MHQVKKNGPQTNQAANKQTSFDSQLASLSGHQCKRQRLTSKYLKTWHGDLKLVSKAFVCAPPPRTSNNLKKVVFWYQSHLKKGSSRFYHSTMPAHSSLVINDSTCHLKHALDKAMGWETRILTKWAKPQTSGDGNVWKVQLRARGMPPLGHDRISSLNSGVSKRNRTIFQSLIHDCPCSRADKPEHV